MATLYERADIYDLYQNENLYQGCLKHWSKILEGRKIKSMLDVSIGTGNLTLAAAELGVQLSGSDLSPAMLERCREKAEKRNVNIDLTCCDFRKLTEHFTRKFDLVAGTGNSLPYVNNQEIVEVLEQMDTLVSEGGYLYFDMRNWDKILRKKDRFYLYNPQYKDDVRTNLVQVWDYLDDGTMTFHLLYTFEKDGKIVQREVFDEHYYPVAQKLLIDKLHAMGYADIQIMCHPAHFENVDPQQADWYCVIAQKPNLREIYSDVSIQHVPALRMARYVMISPQPENDVNSYMERWAESCGLSGNSGAKLIGWDFPFVSPEQQRMGLRGYAAAWILPEGFEPNGCGAEIFCQDEADYARITIRDPFTAPFERIPLGYRRILNALKQNGFTKPNGKDCLPCFESVYEEGGVTYMDVYVRIDGASENDHGKTLN